MSAAIAASGSSKGPTASALGRFATNHIAVLGLVTLALILLAILTYPMWWAYAPNQIDLRALNKGRTPVIGSARTAWDATSSRA